MRIFHRDPAKIGEFVNRGFAAKTTVSGVLNTAERHLCLVMHGGAVDVANP